MPLPTSFPARFLALPALTLGCALVANAFARQDRTLTWTGWVPPTAREAPALVTAHPEPGPTDPGPSTPGPANPGPGLPSHPRPLPTAGAQAPKPALASAPPALDAAARFPRSPSAVQREISSADAWDAYRLQVPFLDARRTAEFLEGHVQGAWSVPVWEAGPEARLTEFEARVNPQPQAPLVLYCGGGGCEDSHLLAAKLVALGYRNLLIYRDGYPDWTAQGRPTQRGARP